MADEHLISVDELRAAGALDVPPAWRLSLDDKEEQLDLFSGLSDDEDPSLDEQGAEPGDESEDEPD